MTIPAGTLVPRDARDFGAFELIAKLATGGMAEIFLARSTQSPGPSGNTKADKVVLKRILPHLAEDEHFVTMFRDEANLASRLIHANVCRVHGLGSHGGTWFIVMEYLHGVALSRMLSRLAKKHQLVDFRIIAGIIVQACEGLHHAHELRDANGHLLNLVHRDVSPPNIMVCSDGLVRLLDFGIAKARGANSKTRTGTVKGKNAYMSPEQILGRALDRRSDVFALGCVMYELIAVKRLFHRDSDFLTFKAITEEPIPDIKDRRPDIPPALRAVLTQALARDPAGRFATARALSEAVKDAVAPLGGPATAVELKKYLVSHFGDELTAREELLKLADDPEAVPGPIPSTGSGPVRAELAFGGKAAREGTESEELEEVDGELESHEHRAADHAIDGGPSILVAGTSAPIPKSPTPVLGIPGRTRPPTQPPPLPTRPSRPTPPPFHGGADGSGARAKEPTTPVPRPVGMRAVTLDDAQADLLKGYRRRSVVRTIVSLALLAAVAIGVIVVVRIYGGGNETRVIKPAPKTPDAVIPDAAPAPPPDANKRDVIEAIARYGFVSIEATAKTTIYIDEKFIGDTPLTRYALPPGIHKVKAVGPKGKIRKFNITIYAAQDATIPMIKWGPK